MFIDTVRCYYRDVGIPGQTELIEFWKERWRSEGWKAEVLGPEDAMKDPRWDSMQEKIASFPCMPACRQFEATNFERWLAFSQHDGAALDYDVFPVRHFPPQDFGPLPICGDGAGGPGFILGRAQDFSRIADEILNYQPEPDDEWQGTPHLCDMRIMRKRHTKLYFIKVLIITFQMPNFGTVPLAHYGNASLDQFSDYFRAMSKTEAIRRLLDKHYTR